MLNFAFYNFSQNCVSLRLLITSCSIITIPKLHKTLQLEQSTEKVVICESFFLVWAQRPPQRRFLQLLLEACFSSLGRYSATLYSYLWYWMESIWYHCFSKKLYSELIFFKIVFCEISHFTAFSGYLVFIH